MAWQAMVAAAIAQELGGIAGTLAGEQQKKNSPAIPGSAPPQTGGFQVPDLYGQDPFTEYLYRLGQEEMDYVDDNDLEERRREILRSLSDRMYGGQ